MKTVFKNDNGQWANIHIYRSLFL